MMLTSLAFCLLTSVEFADLRYEFERVDATTVAVTVTAPADPDGSTEWSLPHEWAGTPRPHDTLVEPSARQADGRGLDVEPVGDLDDDKQNIVLWKTVGGKGPISLRYLIRSAPKADATRVGNDYGTIVQADLFRLHGPLGLVMPSSAPAGQPVSVEIAWKGFANSDANPSVAMVSSLGRGDQRATMPAEEFQQIVLMAGSIAVAEQRIPSSVATSVVCVAMHGSWSFTADELAGFVAPIVAAERAYFRDEREPFFLVTLQSNHFDLDAKNAPGSFSFGGTACTDAFSLYCMPSLSIAPTSPHAIEVKKLIAHEYVHNWIGHVLETSGPEGSAYWFSEGFTDFLARRILHRAGLIDDEAFATLLSDQIRRYHQSPLRLAKNDVIVERYWSDRDASALPYLRGDLVATLLNEELRSASGGARSIDDVIADMLKRARESAWRPSSDELIAVITEATSPAFGAWLRGVVYDGLPIELPTTLRDPIALTKAEMKLQEFDIGFDFEQTKSTGVISGVREGSNAAKAGLRDGMRLKSASIGPVPEGGPPKGVVVIQEGTTERTINYDALGPTTVVPCYRVQKASADPAP